jgi:hypothetical protein
MDQKAGFISLQELRNKKDSVSDTPSPIICRAQKRVTGAQKGTTTHCFQYNSFSLL